METTYKERIIDIIKLIIKWFVLAGVFIFIYLIAKWVGIGS